MDEDCLGLEECAADGIVEEAAGGSLLLWFFLTLGACYVAYKFERNVLVWGIVAVVTTPLVAIIILLILGPAPRLTHEY